MEINPCATVCGDAFPYVRAFGLKSHGKAYILDGWAKPHPDSSRHLTCTDVRFAEVDFLRQLRPRLVIQFIEGLCLLLEDDAAIPLAAEFIATFRNHRAVLGGQSFRIDCWPRRMSPKSEVAGVFVGILTTMEAQRTWRNKPPPNSSSN